MADPGFPRLRCQTRRRCQPVIWPFFFLKTAWKWKKLDRGGTRVPHGSADGTLWVGGFLFKVLADIPCFITQVALEVMLLWTITTLASFLQSNLQQVKCLRRKVVLIIMTLVLYLSLELVKLAQRDCSYLCFRCRIWSFSTSGSASARVSYLRL